MVKEVYARLLIKIYAVPYLYFHLSLTPDSKHLVPISSGTIGKVIGQFTNEVTGIIVTTVEFGDLFADIGPTTWEPYNPSEE